MIESIYLNRENSITDFSATFNQHGIALLHVPQAINIVTTLKEVELFLSPIFKPLQVIRGKGYWHKLSVEFNKDKHKFGGEGHNPLHMDFVNTELPPEILCLFCFRKDFLEGGATLLANIDQLQQRLSYLEQQRLKEKEFSEGQHYNLINVGEELKAFPIIDSKNNWFRFSGKMLSRYTNKTHQYEEVLENVNNIGESIALQIMLNSNQALILNQRMWLHGRTSLGKGQRGISENKRRLFYQGFFSKKV